MKKKTSVAFLALMGLLLFGCGKKSVTTKKNTQTKVTPDTTVTTKKPTTTKKVEKFTVSVVKNIQDAGTITGTGEIEKGKSTTLEATENTGYIFLGFYDGETKLTDKKTYTVENVSKNVTINAKWSALSNALTIKKFSNVDPTTPVEFDDDTYGTVEFVSEEKAEYATGEEITLKATPKTGYQFNGWYLETSEGDHPVSDTDYLNEEITFKMYGAASTIKAVFGTKKCTIDVISNIEEAMDKYTIYYETAGQDGTATNEAVVFDYDGYYEIDAYANAGYEFLGFYEYNEETGEYDNLLDTELIGYAKETVTYMAKFRPYSYELYLNVSPEGVGAGSINVTYNGEEIKGTDEESITYNTTVTLTAVAGEGYTFVRWYNWVTGETISETATFDYLYNIADNLYFGAEFASNNVTVNLYVDTVDDKDNPVADAEIVGECKYNNDIHLKYSDLNPAYDYVGVFTKTYNEETGEYDYIEVPGSYHYADGFKYTITTTSDINLYFVFELGERTTLFYTNIEEFEDTLEEEVKGTYGSTIDRTAPTPAGYTFVGWIDDIYVGWTTDDKPYLVDGYQVISTDPQCPVPNTGYDGYWYWYTRNEYKITYNVNGGDDTSVEFVYVPFGLKTQLEIPTYDQYVFQYWDYTNDQGVRVKFTNATAMMLEPYSFTKDLTIRAKWEKGTVNAVFDTQGGSPIDDEPVTIGHEVPRPEQDPTKEGYTFVNWYTEAEGGALWNFATPISATVTIYAHWSINQYDITIESQNSSVLSINKDIIDGTYDYKTVLHITGSLLDSGYSFDGWYDGDNCVSEELIFDYVLPARNEGVTLVAKYVANIYKVTASTFYYYTYMSPIPGGESAYIKVSGGDDYAYGSNVAITFEKIKDSVVTVYWQSNYSGTWTSIEVTGSYADSYSFVMPSHDVQVQLRWRTATKNLKVSKNITDGDAVYFTKGSDTTIKRTNEGVEHLYSITLRAFTVTGYTFNGWYNKTTGAKITGSLMYTFRMPYEETEYEARYTVNTYKLVVNKTVDDHDDETTNDTTNLINMSKAYKTTQTMTVSAIEGYEFKGWFIQGQSTPVSTAYSYTYTMQAYAVQITAEFEIRSFGIKFDYQISNTNGYYIAPGECTFENNYTGSFDYGTELELTCETISGYTFEGWYIMINGVKSLLSPDATFTYTIRALDDDNCTEGLNYIVPQWKGNTYVVQYFANGGTVSGVGKEIIFGDYFELEVPVYTDHDFTAWYYAKGINKVYLTDEDGNALEPFGYAFTSEALAIQAEYGEHLYTVTFETGWTSASHVNDTKTFQKKAPATGKVTDPGTPIRRGYTFNGWFTEEDGAGTEWNFETPVGSADRTLYAYWTVNSYVIHLRNYSDEYGEITYNINGSTGKLTSGDNHEKAFTVPYGQSFTITATTYLGSRMTAWTYKNAETNNNWRDLSTLRAYTCPNTFACETWIDLEGTYLDEMAYFYFEATTTTCVITSANYDDYDPEDVDTLEIPEYVTGINSGALADFSSLVTLHIYFTGKNRTATNEEALFGYVFGTTNRTGYNEVTQQYWGTTGYLNATKRYIPETLTTVYLEEGTEVKVGAFSYVASLKNIYLPDTITVIDGRAFGYCTGLTAIDLPTGLTKITMFGFQGCASLDSLFIPNTVTQIGEGSFAGCYSLELLSVPFIGATASATGVQGVLGYWFTRGASYDAEKNYKATQNYDSSNSTESIIPLSLGIVEIYPKSGTSTYTIPYGAFMGCTSVSDVELVSNPSTTYNISDYAFAKSGVSYITQGNIGAINSRAFYQSAISSLNFTDTSKLSSIGQYAFAECNSLGTVTIKKLASNSISNYAFYKSSITSLTLYESTSLVIGEHAFEGCTKLKTIDAKKTCKIMGQGFYGCTSLTSVTLNYVRDYINSSAFAACTSLTSFEIVEFNENDTWTQITSNLFKGCTSLKTVKIPKQVVHVSPNIFQGCLVLANIYMPFVGKDRNGSLDTGNSSYQLGYWFGTTKTVDEYTWLQKTSASGTYTTYYLPKGISIYIHLNSVSMIPAFAFNRGTNSGKSAVYVYVDGLYHDSTSYGVGDYAFEGCTSVFGSYLVSSTKKINYIGNYAFYNTYYALNTTLMLSDALTYIGDYAFYKIQGISTNTTIVIGDNVEYVGDYAFANNSFITAVTVGKNAVLGTKVFNEISTSTIYITYTGTGVEYNAIKGSWAQGEGAQWYAGSNITSVVTGDGNTYAVTA